MPIRDLLNQKLRIVQRMKNARVETGKGYLAQYAEIARLCNGYTRLRGSQYFDYRLYDDERFSFEEKSEFAGIDLCERFFGTITDWSFTGMANDKLSAYVVFKGCDLPQANHFAAITSQSRNCGGLSQLKTHEEVFDFFENHNFGPLFIKPIWGMSGIGAHVIHSFDKEQYILNLEHGKRVNAKKFVSNLLDPRFAGFICQEKLSPYPEIREIVGDTIASVRIIALYHDSGPQLLRAVWKLPAGENITDNFHKGNRNILIAALDINTGVIERVISGIPEEEEKVDFHPDSGKPLIGLKVPLWDETIELCKKAAGVFPRVRYQGWDIAITDEGPKILELNVGAHVDILQRAYGRGVFDEEFQAFVKEYSKPKYKNIPVYKE